MNKFFRRWLILLHRWLGILMCLMFALWFSSGMIIMYVQYPVLSENERLGALPVLDPAQISLSPAQAMHSVGLGISGLQGLRLQQLMGRPAYVMLDINAQPVTVFADNGEMLRNLTPTQALAAVAQSGFGMHGHPLQHLGVLDRDQWSINGSLNPHRPLHRISVDDGRGSQLYVSSVSGEIVLDTNTHERFWNWLGSTIHWLYPLQLRQHTTLWSNLVIYLTLTGMVVVISGGIIGFWRLRPGRSQLSPYRGIDRWHHLLGLGSLLFLGTYLFSGLLSMAPWGLFSSSSSTTPQLMRYHDLPMRDLRRFPDLPHDHLQGVREVTWISLGDTGHLLLSREPGLHEVVLRQGETPGSTPDPHLSQRIRLATQRLLPEAEIVRRLPLTDFDNYYYSTHQRHRPLPAERTIFDDDESSWFDIDLNSGQLIQRHTGQSRLYRWLYNGLHSLDFQYLLARRPLWDLLLLTLNVLGLLLSATAILIGWRRLLRSF